MIGKTISHYKILEKLGEGGMGVVYKAEDTKLKRAIALKFLPPELTRDGEAKKRFVHEAQAASALQHTNICTVHDIDETSDGQMFIVMDCYEGETLKDKIHRGSLKLEESIDIAIQIAQGLEKAHKKGIVHRDIKPANIFVTEDGIVKIMDFGVAKLAGQTKLTKTGSTLGTAAYMSPEQAKGGEVDHRTDIWSLGVVFYEMLTGQLPFKGEYEQAVIYSILNEEPKRVTSVRSTLPTELNKIVSKAMVKNPSERYGRAGDLTSDLKSLQIRLEKAKAETKPADSKFSKGKLLYLMGGMIVLVVMLILAKIMMFKAPQEVIDSIAVLPFQNLSADPEQEYFSDGMTEALITELSTIKALRVISRTSVMRFKKTDKSLPEIARELHVKAVIEGSVQRVQDVVRINAQLIRAEPEEHLWARPFTRNKANILELQSEVAQAIANEIKVAVTPEEMMRLTSSRPVNPEAHEAYLKGRFFINKFNEADVKKGISYFEQAIARDSSYALAYAGLAEGYDLLWSLGVMSAKDAFPKIKTWATKALSIDEILAEAYAIIWDVEWAEWNWQGAEENFKRAIRLNPNSAEAHTSYAWYLLMMKRNDEALSEAEHAAQLDPLRTTTKVFLAYILFYHNQYDNAMIQVNEALSIDNNFVAGYRFLGSFYLWRENFKEAIVQFQKAVACGDYPVLAFVTYTYARSGNVMKAREIFADLKTKYVQPGLLALVCIGLGEWDQAFEYLERAYEEHDFFLLIWESLPRGFDIKLDSFRADTRFHTIVKKMGLDEIERRE
jgi:serine/threonine protein kinase/Tfp pilus assembly protein PilF